MRVPFPVSASAWLALVLAPTALRGQGQFVNFEEPQVKPITIAYVQNGSASASYVVACNTPDNSIELYTGGSPHTLVTRVAVGLSPVTVRWNATDGRLYVCNFLGDSVSVVALPTIGTTTNVAPKLERTVHVGDEPVDIVFLPGGTHARVALHGRSQTRLVTVPDVASVSATVLQSPPLPNGINDAVKAPRVLATLPDGRFYALNTMGGNNDYDVDLYVEDPNGAQPLPPPPSPVLAFHLVGGMGTTNTGLAVRSDGNAMYVVGGRALNTDPLSVGVDVVSQQPFGFVESWLWYVDLTGGGSPTVPGAAPVVAAQFPTGPAGAASINLNRDYNGSATARVALGQRMSQPTDVLLIESAPGSVEHVLVAGFGTDRVLVLSTPGGGGPVANAGFQRTAVDVAVHNAAAGYGASGPRGLAHDTLQNRVWVLNRLDNSLASFSMTGFAPGTAPVVTRMGLRGDPTPTTIRSGRPFLYAARQTSGTDNHMVACASCHVDGRTDGLAWNLGHTDTPLTPIPAKLIETALHGTSADPDPYLDFQNAKGPMVTQTLQGLVNSSIETVDTQYVTTNAPYHWRGDKPRFQDFNEAFVRLQGMPNLLSLPARAGLTDPEMDAYTAFVNTIHHPPNPEQADDRRLHGDFGIASNPNDNGSGTLFGLKLYLTKASFGGTPTSPVQSCVHCHALPEGSNNALTLSFNSDGGGLLASIHGNPLETAAVRNLVQRERALVLPGDFAPPDFFVWTRTASFGLTHDGPVTGFTRSINNFLERFTLSALQKTAVVEFVRELDTGVAPLIGRAMSVDAAHAVDSTMLVTMKDQADEANVGVAALTRSQGSVAGYYYDPTVTPGVWLLANGTGPLTDTQLLQLVTGGDDLLVFQAVPTGSERRVAHRSGAPLPLAGLEPTNVELLPMVPNTAFTAVTQFDALWDPRHLTFPFVWPSGPGSDPEPLSMLQTRVLQQSVRQLNPGSTSQPVMAALRHEPPRRFRVTGQNIRHGAKLELGLATQNAGALPVKSLLLDLAPTKYRDDGRVIWETTEELDALMTMVFLHGGPEVPAMQQVLAGDRTQLAATFPSPPAATQAVNPLTWNKFLVNVVNADGSTMSNPTWQMLSIADTR